MHTSPDKDAMLLPWIDATGPRDGIHTHFLLVDGKGVLAGEPSEMLEAQKYYEWSNTLLDGGIVDTSSCFDDAARRACASQAPAADERAELFASALLAMVTSLSESEYRALIDDVKKTQQGYDRLMACLMHSDDVRCEACGDDPI